ncbi:MAG TPA: histidinol-phosphate transaminase [Armatimonadota bacterium]|jgi:histidinol-phosphate aminotransferase
MEAERTPNAGLTPRAAVNRLVPYSPGKPIAETKREFGLTDVIKLGSNENPLGPSPKAVQAMQCALAELHLYPDGAAFSLKEALAAHCGVPSECIAIGNGSDELIHYLGIAYLRTGDNIVQGSPTFVRYESAAVLNEANCISVPLKDLTHDVDAIADALNDRTRLVFLANPCNPTGTMNTKAEVERLIDRLPPQALLVLDEAYAEYVTSPDYPNSLDYVKAGKPVIVLKTFSKIYGIAGLRVGYGLARPDIIRAVEQVREPFNVNTLAQVGALAALSDTEHLERSRANNTAGRRALESAFTAMGLTYAPSQGNFIFVNIGTDCRPVYQMLLSKGVIVRTGDIFGLPTYLRVTIGTPAENARFLAELSAALIG